MFPVVGFNSFRVHAVSRIWRSRYAGGSSGQLAAAAAAADSAPVTIRFDAVVGTEAFACGKSYADIGTTQESLNSVSSHIRQLQTSPGRLLQTLEDSSLDVWNSGTSGVGRDTATKVSYYVKGPVVGLLLDAHIQRLTGGKKSLDDVMRLAYKRYSGTRGFTAEQFRKTTEEVAKVDLKDWFRKVLASTEELDYNEALDWYGLRFSTPDEKQPAKNWSLEIREDATSVQKSHLQRLLGQTGK